MPSSRPEQPSGPRHRDDEQLRLALPTGGALLATVVAVLLAVGVGAAAVLAAVTGPEAGRGAIATTGETRTSPEATRGDSARARTRTASYDVVEGARIKKAPEPQHPRKAKRSKLADKAEQEQVGAVPEFGIAMLNILGSQHTRPGHGYASGASRAATATRMLLSRGVSIVGFSEIQRDQLAVFQRNAPRFGVYPGFSLGAKGVPQTIAWDTAVWRMVEAQTITITFSHQARPQPIVKLANVATGTEIWAMNVHNSPEGQEVDRDRATVAEIARINQLTADGTPLVITGDFNEKVEAFCRFTGETSLVSAVGGTNDGTCIPPAHPRVDWIFATPEFTRASYLVTRAAPVPSITDHAALFARLSIG